MKKKTDLKYYRNKKPVPLTDKQKIELLNTIVMEAHKRADIAEKSLQDFKTAQGFMNFSKEKIDQLELILRYERSKNDRLTDAIRGYIESGDAKAIIVPGDISNKINYNKPALKWSWKFWKKKD